MTTRERPTLTKICMLEEGLADRPDDAATDELEVLTRTFAID
jgi:hypothetical protein